MPATRVTDQETLRALGAPPPSVGGSVRRVTNPDILRQLDSVAPPVAGGIARAILPGRELGIGGAFVQGFASNEQESIRHLAQSLYPDEPLEQAVGRFGRQNGILVHQADDGQLYRALPEGMTLEGVASGLVRGAGKLLPVGAGTLTGLVTAPAAMAGGPGGLAASLTATGTAAGAGEAVRQMLGDYMMGEASTGELSPTRIASEAGSALVGQGAGAGLVAGRTRGAVRDISKLDPQATGQAYDDAARVGIDITPAEATGLPTLAAQQKRLTNITPTADAMREFYTQRNDQVRSAWTRYMDSISTKADAEDVGRLGRDAAQATFDGIKRQMREAAKPKYDEAYAVGRVALTDKLADLMQRPVMQTAIRKALTLAKNEGYSFKPGSPDVRGWDYIKRALDDIARSPAAQNQVTGRQSQFGGAVTNIRREMLDEIDPQVPLYVEARGIWENGIEQLTDPLQAALKELANTKDTKIVAAAQNIFNPRTRTPNMVTRLRSAIEGKNPAAWQALKRMYVQDVTADALRIAESGDVLNPAGKLHKAFLEPRLQENLKAAMSPQEWKRMTDLIVVFKRASSVPALRSDTEFNRLMTKEAEEAARPILAKIMGRNVNVFAWGKATEEFLTNRNLEQHANKVVELITSGDRQAIETMKELRRLSPWDKRWTVLFGHLLSRGTFAGASSLMPEADYAPSQQAR